MMQRSFKPTNSIFNSNAALGLDGWEASNGSISLVNNEISSKGTGTSRFPAAIGTGILPWIEGHKVYSRVTVEVKGDVCQGVIMSARGDTITVDDISHVYNPTQGLYTLSGVKALVLDTGFIKPRIYHYYADAITANEQELIIKKAILIDLNLILPLSLLNLSIINLKAWCDLNIPVWFDGKMSGGKIGGIGGLK
jgi:hypothetical protein